MHAAQVLPSCWDLRMASASILSSCSWEDLGDMGWLVRFSRAWSGNSASVRNRVSDPVVPIISIFLFKSMEHWNNPLIYSSLEKSLTVMLNVKWNETNKRARKTDKVRESLQGGMMLQQKWPLNPKYIYVFLFPPSVNKVLCLYVKPLLELLCYNKV